MRDELYSLGQAFGEFIHLCHEYCEAESDESWENMIEKSDAEDGLLRTVESFLGYYARLSLFAFPARRSPGDTPEGRAYRATRGMAVREALKIDDTHPLAQRFGRNRWAHADEWLDSTLRAAPTARVVLQHVGDSARLTDVDLARVLRLVDPYHGEAFLLGEQLLIDQLHEEASSLFEPLESAIELLQERLGEQHIIWGPTLDEPGV